MPKKDLGILFTLLVTGASLVNCDQDVNNEDVSENKRDSRKSVNNELDIRQKRLSTWVVFACRIHVSVCHRQLQEHWLHFVQGGRVRGHLLLLNRVQRQGWDRRRQLRSWFWHMLPFHVKIVIVIHCVSILRNSRLIETRCRSLFDD